MLYRCMETRVVKIDSARPEREKIQEAVSVVDGGGLVAFPTETVYGIACQVGAEALAKLSEVKGRGLDKYYTLHIGEKSDVAKYVPTIGLKAKKLMAKAWPGPLTVVFELDGRDIERQRSGFEAEVFDNLYKDDSVGIRCPDNAVAAALLQMSNGPVVAPSANIAGQSPAVDAEQVLEQLSGKIELVLDGGACKYQESSSVVKIGKGRVQILRQGVYSESQLQEMSQVKFLFVCTGNICRSPMAEGLFGKYLAEKLECNVDQLGQIGYTISSAGTMGIVDRPASPEAVLACEAKGLDIGAHRSRALSSRLIEESDFIFAMSEGHRQQVVGFCPEALNKCGLLAVEKGVPDPIGQSQDIYNQCADLIEKAVQKRVSELEI